MSLGRTQHYRPDIDGLRALAIILVVGYHAGIAGLDGGFVGVDVFFVISGYVIVQALARERGERHRVDWLAFYARRARRLVPAAVLMFAVTLALGWLLLDPLGDQQALARGAVAAATSTSNFYFLDVVPVDYFTVRADAQAYLHTWSLSVEEQFYLALPILFLIGRSRHSLVAVLAVVVLASLGCAIWLATTDPRAGFFLPTARAYELGIGALLALLPGVSRRWAGPAALLAMGTLGVISMLALSADTFPGAWGLIPAAAAGTLIWAGQAPNVVSRLLTARPAVAIGKVSYGWYLWHWPLLAIATAWNLRELDVTVRVAIVIGALGIASASYRWIEEPLRRGSLSSGWRGRILVTGAAALATTALVSGALITMANREAADPKWQPVSAALADNRDLPATCSDGDEGAQPAATPCVVTSHHNGWPTVVIWGDSHARMFIPALAKAAQGQRVNVVSWTLASCPPYLPRDPSAGSLDAPRLSARLCDAHNTVAARWIDQHADRVILAARWSLYRGQAPDTTTPTREERHTFWTKQQRLTTTTPSLVRHLHGRGIGVDLVAPTPSLWRPAPYCEGRRLWPFDCGIARKTAELQMRDSRRWLAGLLADAPPGTGLIDVTPVLCTEEQCPASRGGHALYHDSHHLTVTAARRTAPWFRPSVAAVLPRVR